ncbi:MAG: polyribonucleotide nucleotidyltransferase [Phycisphaerae bacterium]|jgi:polyribonucleotide nucleotidyltransferase|nr:polyribonucleotide nucleotidyltransferase [Phycisphaerae bacterium]MBT5410119.1 polyribonucleotide nucleotidyltransferase [Phycisphaerae bacterium]MBT7657590.1 polyribonucleotide nucleotidyltransferase [Phycisphaerae bacterium]
MSTKIIVEREIGNRMMRFETGQVAKQASGAVIASYADTVVMCTAMRSNPRPGLDFFPLQCDYRERTSAAGKFPGGFRKREGAPNEKEILTMRLMDRPIRPLFPDGYIDECQIQAWVMSHDGENDADVLACTAASAALCLTDSPFEGPVATVRVGRIVTDEGETFVLNPTHTQMQYSDLDLVLSGHSDGVNMIEIGAAQVNEAAVMGAIKFGYEEGIKPILELQNELAEKAGATEKRIGDLALPSDEVMAKVKDLVGEKMLEVRRIPGKADRSDAVNALRTAMIDENFVIPEGVSYSEHMAAEKTQRQAKEAFRKLEKKSTRTLIVEESIRADGRDFDTIRDLEMDTTVFPRTHGSAFFQRGETQSLVTCTLGTGRDEQVVDGLMPEYAKKFYLHYNFPPFSVGEAGRIMGPGRREIGHGALAERSLLGILPEVEDFPYTIRLVSDITESNGSSSMASVCGGCLALMDAGVPIQNTCAGISVGRFSNDEGKIVRVMDILGEEDFFGDMDFKVCGTKTGITGVQLDLKARGLWFEEIEIIFEMARKGRFDIIDLMEAHLAAPREEMSEWAPRMLTVPIDPEKIGKLIGPGGKTIRQITEDTGANIDINDDGIVFISSVDMASAESAKAAVEAIAAEIKVGSVFEGKVVSTRDFGAFIEIAPGTDGMCHISELADGFVDKVENICKVGDKIKVKVINVDDTGRIKLSVKALLKDAAKDAEKEAETVES